MSDRTAIKDDKGRYISSIENRKKWEKEHRIERNEYQRKHYQLNKEYERKRKVIYREYKRLSTISI